MAQNKFVRLVGQVSLELLRIDGINPKCVSVSNFQYVWAAGCWERRNWNPRTCACLGSILPLKYIPQPYFTLKQSRYFPYTVHLKAPHMNSCKKEKYKGEHGGRPGGGGAVLRKVMDFFP